MRNVVRSFRPGIRRTIWRPAYVVFFAAFCVSLTRAGFAGLPRGCRHHYRAAWGFSEARDAALSLLEKAAKCPSPEKISTAGRAAQIAANLFGDANDECQDDQLNGLIESVCGPEWKTQFVSSRWHAHADGTQYLPGRHWYLYVSGFFFVGVPLVLAVKTSARLHPV